MAQGTRDSGFFSKGRLAVVLVLSASFALCAAIYWVTGNAETRLSFPQGPATAQNSDGKQPLVDLSPWLTAQALAPMADSAEERRYARDAERLADHDVDQAFAAALRMAALRDRFEAALKAQTPAAVIFGGNAGRLPNTTLFAAPGLKAETAIISFDLNGIAVSSGAACSSGKVQISSVLTAMGVEDDLARGAVRVSLGWTTTVADIDLLLNAWMRVASTLLKSHANAA